jgi:single-strand DNA-binding protein
MRSRKFRRRLNLFFTKLILCTEKSPRKVNGFLGAKPFANLGQRVSEFRFVKGFKRKSSVFISKARTANVSNAVTNTTSTSQPRSWKHDKGDYETPTEWHRVFAWRNLSKFAKTLQKGQLVTREGILRYREGDEVKGTTFRHRIAEVHATSLKRLSKVEAR